MRANSLITLGVVTVGIAGVAAWVATRPSPGADARPAETGLLFAQLRERANDVAEVALTTASESFTLRRSDAGWGLADKGGYPVDVDRVKALVLGIAELTLVEPKTANPELWPKLEVQDPTSAPDAPSKRVRIATGDGQVLADVVIGRQEYGGGANQSTVFVRKVDGGPALEARGRLSIEGRAANWLDRDIAKLERKRVRDVQIDHPAGERLRVFRESPDLNDFDVADLPEGAELSWAGVAGGIAGALEYLSLEDVIPLAQASFDDTQAVAARFTTFDGLVVTVRSVEQDDKTLLKVAAEFDPSVRAAEPAGPPPPPEEGAEAPAPAPVGKSVEEVTQEAEAIRARVQDWVYVVSGYAGANLRKRLEDLLKKPEPPETPLPGEEPAPAPDEGGGQPSDQAPAAPEVPAEPPQGGGGEPAAGSEPAGGIEPKGGGEPAGGG